MAWSCFISPSFFELRYKYRNLEVIKFQTNRKLLLCFYSPHVILRGVALPSDQQLPPESWKQEIWQERYIHHADLSWFMFPLISLGCEGKSVTSDMTLEKTKKKKVFDILIGNGKQSVAGSPSGTLKSWSSMKHSSVDWDQAGPLAPRLINTWLALNWLQPQTFYKLLPPLKQRPTWYKINNFVLDLFYIPGVPNYLEEHMLERVFSSCHSTTQRSSSFKLDVPIFFSCVCSLLRGLYSILHSVHQRHCIW